MGSPLRLPSRAPARHVQRLRVAPGTTVHVATYVDVDVRVVLVRGQTLAAWCAARGVDEAIVGGFFTRPGLEPLGELRTRGVLRRHAGFDDPWARVRACVHICGGAVAIAGRDELPATPRGDLLQAGPLLVRDGRAVYERASDPEGFSAGAHQFDSDITAGRYPRAAIGITRRHELLAVACDGRADDEAGLTMAELAEAMAALGAVQAMNLDGGGSTSLICGGRLRNVPREAHGAGLPGGRAVATAIVFRRH
jgi:hypothetical protein